MNDSAPKHMTSLLSEARQGNAQAAAQLLAGYRNYLRLLARVQIDRVLQAKIDPSDLVQEVCLRVHQDLQQFHGTTEAEFLAWLRSILAAKGANLARRFRGTQRRNVHLEQQLLASAEQSSLLLANPLVSRDSAPSARAQRNEHSVAIANALAQLPDHYREVVILHNLEEPPLQQVADQMGRTVESVRKLWARAVIQLRRLLEGMQ